MASSHGMVVTVDCMRAPSRSFFLKVSTVHATAQSTKVGRLNTKSYDIPNLRFMCLLLRPHGAHPLLSLDVDGQHK